MKVELEKLRLGVKALTGRVCAGIPEKDNVSFKHDKDVTSDFIRCIIDWGVNTERVVSGGGKMYEITVREIKE